MLLIRTPAPDKVGEPPEIEGREARIEAWAAGLPGWVIWLIWAAFIAGAFAIALLTSPTA